MADGRLTATWRFPDFLRGLAFVNAVAAVAEDMDHHPDLHLAWGRVTAVVWTHAIGGLSRADFVLAAKIDAVAAELRVRSPAPDP